MIQKCMIRHLEHSHYPWNSKTGLNRGTNLGMKTRRLTATSCRLPLADPGQTFSYCLRYWVLQINSAEKWLGKHQGRNLSLLQKRTSGLTCSMKLMANHIWPLLLKFIHLVILAGWQQYPFMIWSENFGLQNVLSYSHWRLIMAVGLAFGEPLPSHLWEGNITSFQGLRGMYIYLLGIAGSVNMKIKNPLMGKWIFTSTRGFGITGSPCTSMDALAYNWYCSSPLKMRWNWCYNNWNAL